MKINMQVLEGIIQHSKVHSQQVTPQKLTAFPVVSETLGIVGIIDVVEKLSDTKNYRLMEHKRGSAYQWENDQLQIVAQSIAFEETTGFSATIGSVFSWKTRRRYEFSITDDLKNQTREAIIAMHNVLATSSRPAPTRDTYKCSKCSVAEVCQPHFIQKINQ